MEKFGKVCKEYMIKEMAKQFKDYSDFFISSFSRVNMGNIEKLRKALDKKSARYMVVKNSLVKRAMDEAGKKWAAEDMKALVTGSCGVLFSKDNPVIAAKALVNFSKENKEVKIQGAFLNGKPVSSDTIGRIAMLPSRKVLLSMVAAGTKAPITGFIGLLGNLLRNLVGVIDAISKSR